MGVAGASGVPGGAKMIFAGGLKAAAATYLCHPNFTDGGTETGNTGAEKNAIMTFAGTLKNLYAYTESDLTSQTIDVTVYVNGVASALTVQVADGSGDNDGAAVADTSNNVSVSVGDKVLVEVVIIGGTQDVGWSFELVAS